MTRMDRPAGQGGTGDGGGWRHGRDEDSGAVADGRGESGRPTDAETRLARGCCTAVASARCRVVLEEGGAGCIRVVTALRHKLKI